MNTLPQLATPKFSLVVPSTKESVTYRPYLIKEEKILLMAVETGDDDQMTNAIIDIISSCFTGIKDINKLAPFDLEFLFVNLRSKSVGEGVDVNFRCDECDDINNKLHVDLDKVEIRNLDVSNQVKIADDMVIEMRYPGVHESIGGDTAGIIKGITGLIQFIYHKDETYDVRDVKKEEVTDFVDHLTTDQFGELLEVVSNMPYLGYDLKYKCTKCGHANERELKGLLDFFM